MGFASKFTVFFLAVGSPFPGQAVSLELQRSSSIEHHRTIRESSDGCPTLDFIKYNGNCYYFSKDHKEVIPTTKWDAAKAACESLGNAEKPVRLAELGNADDCKSDGWLMKQIKAKGEQVWLGAKDHTTTDGWKWLSGRDLSIDEAYWGPDQPNNHNNVQQHCLSTIKEGDRVPKRQYFNDADCEAVFHYVCQYFPKILNK